MALINTRDGNYSAACAMDFMHPPHYYDTFAMRDSEGHEPVMSKFPYFRAGASRKAMVYGQPVPVQSCWNGAGEYLQYDSTFLLLEHMLFLFSTVSYIQFSSRPWTQAASKLTLDLHALRIIPLLSPPLHPQLRI